MSKKKKLSKKDKLTKKEKQAREMLAKEKKDKKSKKKKIPKEKKIKQVAKSCQTETKPQAPLIIDFNESKLVELAVDVWRLEKNIKKAIPLEDHRPIKSSLEKMHNYLNQYDIEISDFNGNKYYENMNVRLLSTQEMEELEIPTIIDTIKPAVIVKGKLASQAAVIVGVPSNNNSKEDTPDKETCNNE